MGCRVEAVGEKSSEDEQMDGLGRQRRREVERHGRQEEEGSIAIGDL